MLAIELLKKNLSSIKDYLPIEKEELVCAITGKPAKDYVSVNKYYEFPPFNFMAVPSSLVMDAELAEILKDGHLKWNSWFIGSDRKFQTIKRKKAREIILNLPKPPWGMYCAEDVRRQGGLVTLVNFKNHNPIVSLGESYAYAKNTAEIYPDIEKMYISGVGRDNLLTLTAHHANFAKLQIDYIDWIKFKKLFDPIKNSSEYRLAVWLLPTKEELNGKEEIIEK